METALDSRLAFVFWSLCRPAFGHFTEPREELLLVCLFRVCQCKWLCNSRHRENPPPWLMLKPVGLALFLSSASSTSMRVLRLYGVSSLSLGLAPKLAAGLKWFVISLTMRQQANNAFWTSFFRAPSIFLMCLLQQQVDILHHLLFKYLVPLMLWSANAFITAFKKFHQETSDHQSSVCDLTVPPVPSFNHFQNVFGFFQHWQA